jgi:phage shock protein A
MRGNTVPATPLPEVIQVEEQERDSEELDESTREALARSVLEGPGGETPRTELADKAADEESPGGGRLDDLDEVAQAARSAEEQQE